MSAWKQSVLVIVWPTNNSCCPDSLPLRSFTRNHVSRWVFWGARQNRVVMLDFLEEFNIARSNIGVGQVWLLKNWVVSFSIFTLRGKQKLVNLAVLTCHVAIRIVGMRICWLSFRDLLSSRTLITLRVLFQLLLLSELDVVGRQDYWRVCAIPLFLHLLIAIWTKFIWIIFPWNSLKWGVFSLRSISVVFEISDRLRVVQWAWSYRLVQCPLQQVFLCDLCCIEETWIVRIVS
jgi:hypothetical protein